MTDFGCTRTRTYQNIFEAEDLILVDQTSMRQLVPVMTSASVTGDASPSQVTESCNCQPILAWYGTMNSAHASSLPSTHLRPPFQMATSRVTAYFPPCTHIHALVRPLDCYTATGRVERVTLAIALDHSRTMHRGTSASRGSATLSATLAKVILYSGEDVRREVVSAH
jgi:hypothetical protein